MDVAASTQALQRTAHRTRAAVYAKVKSVNDGGTYDLKCSDGSVMSAVRAGDGQDGWQKNDWVTALHDGSGWFVAGISTHQADGTMGSDDDP